MKTGRNDPCPCGSGNKYKHCHLPNDTAVSPDLLAWRRLSRVIDESRLLSQMFEFVAEHYGMDAIDEAWAEFFVWRNIVDGVDDADDDVDLDDEAYDDAPENDDSLDHQANDPQSQEIDADPDASERSARLIDRSGQSAAQLDALVGDDQSPADLVDREAAVSNGANDEIDDWFYDDDEYTSFDPDSPFAEVFAHWLFALWDPDRHGTTVANPDLFEVAPVKLYLQLRGHRLDPLLREYLTSLTTTAVSIFEVDATHDDGRLEVRDVILQSALTVFDGHLHKSVKPGDVLMGFIGSAGGISMFTAVWPYPLRPIDTLEIIEFREQIAAQQPLTRELLRDYNIELSDFYFDTLERRMRPPQLTTTDGELLQPQVLNYAIDSADDAFEALHELDVTTSREAQWQAASTTDGRVQQATIHWTRVGNAQHPDWDSTVLGRIRLSAGRMQIDVASGERRERIQALIDERLGPRARLVSVDSPPSAPQAPMDGPEVDAAMAEFVRRHYETWPDQPLPALDGLTPREASATAIGREKVTALLRGLDVVAKPQPGHQEAIRRLRHELGISPPA